MSRQEFYEHRQAQHQMWGPADVKRGADPEVMNEIGILDPERSGEVLQEVLTRSGVSVPPGEILLRASAEHDKTSQNEGSVAFLGRGKDWHED
jgi:hypothetical protein